MSRKKMPWFRFYTEAPTDPKVRRLRAEHRWVWVCVLAAARTSPEPGQLLVATGVPMTVRDLADFAGVSEKVARSALDGMERVGLAARSGNVWGVPSWADRQYPSDTSTDRVRAHRSRNTGPNSDDGTFHRRSSNGGGTFQERFSNGLGNAPDTETDTDTDTEPLSDGYAGSAEAVTERSRKLIARLRGEALTRMAKPDAEALVGASAKRLDQILADFDPPDDVLVSYLLGETANLGLYRRGA